MIMITYYWHEGLVYTRHGKILRAMNETNAHKTVESINTIVGTEVATLIVGPPPKSNGTEWA
jgi:hypothetical protein